MDLKVHAIILRLNNSKSSELDPPCLFPVGAGMVKGGGRGASTWTALHPTVLEKLPAFIQLQLPITFTRRGAVDRAMLDRLIDSILRGGSFTEAADGIREACMRRDMRLRENQMQFLLYKEQLSAAEGKSPTQELAGQSPALHTQSPPGVSRAGNSSKHLENDTSFQPSRQYLSAVWLEAMRPTIDWANRFLSTITGRFWCLDHTFATATRVRDANQQPVYKAVLTVVNEYCQVVAQWFTHTTSLLEVRSGLEKLTERYKDEAIQVYPHSSALPSIYKHSCFLFGFPRSKADTDRLG